MDTVSQEEMKDIFDMLDGDRSGFIRLEELSNGLRALGLNPSESHLEVLFRKADVNSDGKLSFEEFERLYKECAKKDKVNFERLRSELSQFDRDKDGTISASELREILCNGGEALTESQVEEIIRDFDTSGDGKLNLDELINGLLKRDLH